VTTIDPQKQRRKKNKKITTSCLAILQCEADTSSFENIVTSGDVSNHCQILFLFSFEMLQIIPPSGRLQEGRELSRKKFRELGPV
jgi:hypothetical protein